MAAEAVARFYQTLSPGRRRKLKVHWVVPERRMHLPEVRIPSKCVYLDELEQGDLQPDLWLVMDPDTLPPLAREEGIVLMALPARKAGVWRGVINLPVRSGESASELAEAISWVYDDPGLKEMMRRRRAAIHSNATS